jgi:hypothetical protein
MCQMHQEERFKFFFNIRNIGALPLDPTYPKSLSVWSSTDLPYHTFLFIMKNKVERAKIWKT